MTNERPSLMNAAGWMALPVGAMWSLSFLCAMYGIGQPMLSLLGQALAIVSIFMLNRQLTNYRRLFPAVSWLHIMQLSLVTCLLAGLLTDVAQYAYFLWLDGGRMLSFLSEAFQNEAYRESLSKLMPEADLAEVQKMIQGMSVRDIMSQLVIYNVMIALPVSLLAALPVRKSKEPKN